jgi:uncharacterized protein (TIGR01244 family)
VKISTIFALTVLSAPVWAAEINAPGVPNFHQVNEHLFRGGQPVAEGWQSLAKLGVKVVVDLRREDEHSSADEAQAVKAAGMQYINVPMKGVVSPTDEQVARVLAAFSSAGPVFVHCKRGADRTGTVIACYRMSHDHWDNKRALDEAKSFGMRWTQVGLKEYVKNFHNAPVLADAGAQLSDAVQ